MRIVIDLQGAQTRSRLRGIGRYSLALARALAVIRGNHEILIVLNGLFTDTIEPIRAALEGLLPQQCIRVWEAPDHLDADAPARAKSIEQTEAIREAFLASLQPDFVLITSLFEGFGDTAATSVKRCLATTTAVLLHDLIPLIHREIYLANPAYEAWYLGKLDHIKRADLLLCNSASTAKEASDWLGFEPDRIVSISTACDDHFQPQPVPASKRQHLEETYGLKLPYVMYTGNLDHRKNIDRLIRAYSLLPGSLRKLHQLVIVSELTPVHRAHFLGIASAAGLSADELVLTGYVPDSDLIMFYNAAKVFIFPSWHEGFGLPALEAMRCGKAVIASNTSSLPEVIGRNDALFDPFDESSIAAKMAHVLENDAFRADLERHGIVQAARFDWQTTARHALDALERFHAAQIAPMPAMIPARRPRLAYISPLPPEKSGIADYSAELLQVLTRHYSVEVIVAQRDVTDAYIRANCTVRNVGWMREHAGRYERVLYHFGNSSFHEHMFDMLEAVPGVVVLHDFFLSGIAAHREGQGVAAHAWTRALASSHGLHALHQRYTANVPADVIWSYPCNLPVLQGALGIIVHSEAPRRLATKWFGPGVGDDWALIPLLRSPALRMDRIMARKALGVDSSAFIVCAFGILGPHKLNHRLLDAWLASPMAHEPQAQLVFVGEGPRGDYGTKLLRTMRGTHVASQTQITGWVDDKTYRLWLTAADVGVQLRAHSSGETSAAVLDCMNHGLATIVNAYGSMADLDADAVWILPAEFGNDELVAAMTALWLDPAKRMQLGQNAREIILGRHSPRACAEQYAHAIEHFYGRASIGLPGLAKHLADIACIPTPALATALARNFPPNPRRRQLLIDISALVQHDLRTGIQRVVRSILREWLLHPPTGWQVEPVYATPVSHGYHYATQFASRFLGIPAAWANDEVVEAWPDDVFVGLDLHQEVVPAQSCCLHEWRNRGVNIWFVAYDLLPVLLPQTFPEGARAMHQSWLEVVSRFDGVVCISKTVANEFRDWLAAFGPERHRPLRISWFHLGADIDETAPTMGRPDSAEGVLAKLRTKPSFLMVGTIEPRKAHGQVLEAFEQLWRSDLSVNLVFVGKQGWMVEELAKRIRAHSELNNRLFWLEGISDEYLKEIYAASTGLIAASYGEGFGLPLIEAAQHKIPVIARNIPVFREVAGDHAYYFDANNGAELAEAMMHWLSLYKDLTIPRSDGMNFLTWKQSAEQLMRCCITEPLEYGISQSSAN